MDKTKPKSCQIDTILTQFLVLATFLVVTIGGSATMFRYSADGFGSKSAWYTALNKPVWNPPSWLFSPMWRFLYASMAVAAWLVWREGGFKKQALPLFLYIVQLGLNFVWVPLFGTYHELFWAWVEIIPLWLCILGMVILFKRVSALAGYLIVPYLGWMSLSLVLNYTVWSMNREDMEPHLSVKSEL